MVLRQYIRACLSEGSENFDLSDEFHDPIPVKGVVESYDEGNISVRLSNGSIWNGQKPSDNYDYMEDFVVGSDGQHWQIYVRKGQDLTRGTKVTLQPVAI